MLLVQIYMATCRLFIPLPLAGDLIFILTTSLLVSVFCIKLRRNQMFIACAMKHLI